MKIKHIPIKQYLVRVKKKDKSRGRPSKMEIVSSQIVSNYMKENRESISKIFNDSMVHGVGIAKIKF